MINVYSRITVFHTNLFLKLAIEWHYFGAYEAFSKSVWNLVIKLLKWIVSHFCKVHQLLWVFIYSVFRRDKVYYLQDSYQYSATDTERLAYFINILSWRPRSNYFSHPRHHRFWLFSVQRHSPYISQVEEYSNRSKLYRLLYRLLCSIQKDVKRSQGPNKRDVVLHTFFSCR